MQKIQRFPNEEQSLYIRQGTRSPRVKNNSLPRILRRQVSLLLRSWIDRHWTFWPSSDFSSERPTFDSGLNVYEIVRSAFSYLHMHTVRGGRGKNEVQLRVASRQTRELFAFVADPCVLLARVLDGKYWLVPSVLVQLALESILHPTSYISVLQRKSIIASRVESSHERQHGKESSEVGSLNGKGHLFDYNSYREAIMPSIKIIDNTVWMKVENDNSLR